MDTAFPSVFRHREEMAADEDPWKSKYLAIKQLCEEHQMVRLNECMDIYNINEKDLVITRVCLWADQRPVGR